LWLDIGMVILAYLIGSISTGYVMGWLLRGIDIRQYGSGRTGGTNALRTLGPVGAAITAAGDVGKSAAAVALAKGLGLSPWVVALAALAAVLGHNYPFYLRFRGGAGVAPTIGALLMINWWMGLGLGAVAAVLVVITRYASAGSLALVNLTPLIMAALALARELPWAYLILGVTVAVLVTWSHRPNIARLLAGTERKLGEGGHRITSTS
jgi:glycerol-3-phosphate acyltransferase PlsY